jgi:hypothetical protein
VIAPRNSPARGKRIDPISGILGWESRRHSAIRVDRRQVAGDVARCQFVSRLTTFYSDDNKAIATVNISADAMPDMIDSILVAVGIDTGQFVVRR